MPDNLPTLFPDASPNRRDQHIARMQRHSQTLHPQQSKGSRVSHTTRGFFVDTPPAEAPGASASARLLIVMSVHGDYLKCKEPDSINSGGVPSTVSGDFIYVAKDWAFRKSVWDGHNPSPYGAGIQFDDFTGSQQYRFSAMAFAGITAEMAMYRAVYVQDGLTTANILRYEYVSPPWVPVPTWNAVTGFLSVGSFILAVDMGETIMSVSGNDVTLVDATPRAWVPKAQVTDKFTITGIGTTTISGRRSGALSGVTIELPPPISTITSPYTSLGINSRQGLNTADTTGQQQTWIEELTPPYQTGQVILATQLPDGTWCDLNREGRTWQIKVDSNWFCTQTPNTQITGRITGPYAPAS